MAQCSYALMLEKFFQEHKVLKVLLTFLTCKYCMDLAGADTGFVKGGGLITLPKTTHRGV